ncbi:MAG TPA: peptidoglycan DD-metalloendopeptidase family protein [Ignavibacteria bacterium]|nr:peptidoglycan DD-metalloendopeptidase family protein [Ignavibacteria bacterium]HMR39797.1 peptidoglycan DD-metalloendopeptidase family protein [Ignavibacteria bacterium]
MKTILVFFLLIAVNTANSQVKKISDDLYFYSDKVSEPADNCGLDVSFDPAIHQNLTTPLNLSAISYIWPLEEPIDTGVNIVNYVDDLSGSSIKDYNDGTWSYNGHNGTDICLHDFRHMDRFSRVIAAASGTVVKISVGNFDRNTGWGTGSPANLVQIRHSDGTYAFYYHLMKNSISVKLGEYVLQGQTIGYVGSSGNSTDAHLHFEPGYYSGNTWVKRDPWQGTYNHSASLWMDQEAYVGFRDFKMIDFGVYTQSLVGGNFDSTGVYFKERILQPNTVSGYESKIGFWLQLQGSYTGKQIRFQLRKSDGTLFTETYFYLSDQTQYGWYWWTPNFNPGIAVTGDWYVRVLYDNVEKGRCFFNVQLLTSNRPRMYPVAGKCFRKSIFVQRDTLRVRPVRSNMQYDLLGAPAGVTLTQDSILNISISSQLFRTSNFKVIASIGGSATLRDTMNYCLVDTTKNRFPGNGIESLELRGKIEGFWNGSTMVPDTVTVLLRAPLAPYNIADSVKVVLNSAGYALVSFLNINPGIYYYLVVKHRNSIETWSKTAMQFTTNVPLSYDFTTSKTKAYGDNLILKSGEYCFYSGDVNQDGNVNLSDISQIYNISNAFFASTYDPTDLTGNGLVGLEDILLGYNNSAAFAGKVRP